MTIHSVTGHLDPSGALTRIDVRGAASGHRAVDVSIEVTGKTLCRSASVSDDDTWETSFDGSEDASLTGFACGGLMAARVAPEDEPARHAEWVGPLDCRAAERQQEPAEAEAPRGDGRAAGPPAAGRPAASSAGATEDRASRSTRQGGVVVASAPETDLDPSSLVTVMVAQPDRAEATHQPPAPGRARPPRADPPRAQETTRTDDRSAQRDDRPPPRADHHDDDRDREDGGGLDAKLDDLKAKLDDLTDLATRDRVDSEERSRQPDGDHPDDGGDDHSDDDDDGPDAMDALREKLEDLSAKIENAVSTHESSRGSHDWRPVEQATEERSQRTERAPEGHSRRSRPDDWRDEPARLESREPGLATRARDRAESRWRDVSDRWHREDPDAPRRSDARHRDEDRDRPYRDDDRYDRVDDRSRYDRDEPRRYRDDEPRDRADDRLRDREDARGDDDRRRDRDEPRNRSHDDDRDRADDEARDADEQAEDEGTPWISGILLILAEAALLVSMAAAGYPILIAVSAALVVPMAAGFAASNGARSWALWSMGGLGLGALVVIVLLPIVGFVDLDVYLLAAGIAVVILGIGIGTLFLTGGGDSADEDDS